MAPPSHNLVFATVALLLSGWARGADVSAGIGLKLEPDQGADSTRTEWKGDQSPWFCHGIDCPRYKVVEKKGDYEVREYEATKWASTVVPGMALDQAESQGFMRLFGYISGGNEGSTSIPMTAPVKNYITPGEGPFCSTNFTISFFVPPAFQESTPKPTSEEVFFTYEGTVTKYVKQFRGRASQSKVLDESSAFAEILLKDGIAFDKEHYEYCGYDPPFRLVNRHNEIWFTAKSSR